MPFVQLPTGPHRPMSNSGGGSAPPPSAPPKFDPLAHLRLLTLKQVRAIVGYSANHIYRRMRAGTFPQSIRIGPNSVRWTQLSIELWLAQQAEQSPQNKPADPDQTK